MVLNNYSLTSFSGIINSEELKFLINVGSLIKHQKVAIYIGSEAAWILALEILSEWIVNKT